MWETITYVGSGFTLAAFVTAVAAWVIKGQSEEKAKLISCAKDETRAKLVQDTLEFFHVETRNLIKKQQFEIAMEQIKARANRFKTIALLIGLLTIVAASLSAYAISELNNPSSHIPSNIGYIPTNELLRTGTGNQWRAKKATSLLASPSFESEAIAKLPAATVLVEIESLNDWIYVKTLAR